jgi:SAM domain (Sterile alpha motif)
MDDIGAWLTALGLERYVEAFRRHEIDLGSVTLLSDADLERSASLSVPAGRF